MDDVEDINEALKRFDNSKVTGDRSTVTTSSGLTGVMEPFTGVNVEGVVATFSIDGTGVQILAIGPPDAYEANQDDITAMIESLSSTTPEGDA